VNLSFTHTSARSFTFTATICFIVAVESVAVHFLLFRWAPVTVSVLSLLGALSLAWLVADYRALGARTSTVTADAIRLEIGRRVAGHIPLRLVTSAVAPTWRDFPAPPGSTLLDATRPTEPNVLLRFSEPVVLRLLDCVHRPFHALAFCVDHPEAFLAEVRRGVDSSARRGPSS
jgi:hypothetical protein